MTTMSVAANGLDISYVTEGHGPPLLMLHGATSMGIHDWGAQRPLLRAEFTLYMPDARGHHRTRYDVRAGWSQQALIDDAIAFADALDLESFHLMGLSMGAITAIHLASRQPERVRSLIAVSPSLEPEPRTSVARRRFDPDAIRRNEPIFAAELKQRHDTHQGPEAWERLVLAMRDAPGPPELTPEDLHRIRVPVLLAYGDNDPWVPLEQAVRLKRQLVDGELLVVPGCGHVVEAERPSVFNPAMMQFLRRARSAG